MMENKVGKLLSEPLIVLNLGLKEFSHSLEEQEVEVVQIDWQPPAGGDQDMIDLLDQLL